DGFCCNTACAGGCDRCDVMGAAGTCTVVAAGNAGAAPACAPYLCDGLGAACPSTCLGDAGCAAGSFCNANKQCVAKLALGAACGGANHCASGFCADQVCCSAACRRNRK